MMIEYGNIECRKQQNKKGSKRKMAEANSVRHGSISVETRNIFPVIKKWLYSDKEIFIREIVSNACDAVTKHKRLVSLGEAEASKEPYRIDVVLDKELSTLTVSDNGIGMTEEEIDKYINQIALSGALDFIEKYEGKSEEEQSGIIGHFGLGFYSSFMIADKVELVSKSYAGSKTTKWTGLDTCEFTMEETEERATRGTDVILYVNDDEKEFLSGTKIKDMLEKFCSFMPVEIYYTELPKEESKEEPKESDKKDGEEKEPEEKPINDTTPLWQKKPSDCTPEEYKEFYRKVFHDWRDPLFYVHINADYPLNFKGILFFPPMDNEYSTIEGQVKLYYNQVFVADNIKEVIPDFLMILKGVLDCPELPLNVSRSYLQANGYVAKISAHIVKKMADKLTGMYNTAREEYEKIWHDIKPFVEYGCMKDTKFADRVNDVLLLKTTDEKFLTVKEYADTEGFDKVIYYTDNEVQQSRYISMFKSENIPVVCFDSMIDAQFISFLESKFASVEDEKLKGTRFSRVDAGISKSMKADGEVTEDTALCDFVKAALALGENTKVSTERLKDTELPAMLNLTEDARRYADMMKMYMGKEMPGMPAEETLVLNLSNPLVAKLSSTLSDESRKEVNEKIAKQIYRLALVAHRQLTSDELRSFITDSAKLMEEL